LKSTIYNPQYIFWSKVFSFFIAPYYKFFNVFRKKFSLECITVKTILVTEYHRIGDVIIIAPVLKSIKNTFPNAHIILVCNKETENLARYLKLADEIRGVSVPWTNWDWSLLAWIRARSFARQFRPLNIDIGIDFKGDLRNAWFLWHTYSKISFGYSTTGGKFFFTNPQKMKQNLHQVLRAERIIRSMGCQPLQNDFSLHHYNEKGSIVFHTGTSDKKRSWPDSHWIKLANALSPKYNISIIKTFESDALIKKLKKTNLSINYFEGSLVNLAQWLGNQKCLIAPDSMAGHLASHIGIPVISLFGSQNPNLTKPNNKLGKLVLPNKPCKHNRKHWRLCRFCIASISPEKVYNSTLSHLSYIKSIQ